MRLCCSLLVAIAYIRVLVLVDSMEVEWLVVDEELGGGDLHCADANRQGVHVLCKAIIIGLCRHLYLRNRNNFSIHVKTPKGTMHNAEYRS